MVQNYPILQYYILINNILQEFIDDGNGHISGIKTVKVNWTKDEAGRWKMDEVPNSEHVYSI